VIRTELIVVVAVVAVVVAVVVVVVVIPHSHTSENEVGTFRCVHMVVTVIG
jgi:hypothetical protein